jgi:hypothetical protein
MTPAQRAADQRTKDAADRRAARDIAARLDAIVTRPAFRILGIALVGDGILRIIGTGRVARRRRRGRVPS